MNINGMIKSFTRSTCTFLKKNEHNILLGAGLVTGAVGVIGACKATVKAIPVIEDHNAIIDEIHAKEESMDEKEYKKELMGQYVKTGGELVKLYSGPAVMLIASAASFIGSNKILSNRNAALGAAYATLDGRFKDYREKVAAKYGKDTDKEIRHNLEVKEVVDAETGEITKDYVATDGTLNGYSDYARFFDESSIYYEKNPEYNLQFLRKVQDYANRQLQSVGYLFLNDVYRALGLPTTKAGQVVGWIYKIGNEEGDNFIDFGIYNIKRKAARDFVNGYESVILLDFNVDGNILDKFERV